MNPNVMMIDDSIRETGVLDGLEYAPSNRKHL